MTRPAGWVEQAVCREVDPELFFPEKGRVDQVAAAVRVCGRCPVKADCLDAALRLPVSVDSGVWGGTTPQQRRTIRESKRRRRS